MRKAAKTRVLLLSLATVTTLLALTPPKPVQACVLYTTSWCYDANGVGCQQSDCPRFNQCTAPLKDLHGCEYMDSVCCP